MNEQTKLYMLTETSKFMMSFVIITKNDNVIIVDGGRPADMPLLGVGVAYLFFSAQFNGAHFASFVAMFATPVAVSSVPMAQEMNSDATLAGQLVVWTTIASAFSVFLAAFLLKLGGVFG